MAATVDTNNEEGQAIEAEQDFSDMPDEFFRHAKVDAGFLRECTIH